MFAQLPPGASLVRHRDPYAGSIRYHLGLVTPGNPRCFIDVDGQQYVCDIERPMRFQWAAVLNRLFAAILLRAAASPNDERDRTGFLNRVFKYVYAVRRVGKRIKAWHRPTYYILKWTMPYAPAICEQRGCARVPTHVVRCCGRLLVKRPARQCTSEARQRRTQPLTDCAPHSKSKASCVVRV